jgi:alkylation response protein AidB-like acyl-CoA dehydrogenase
MSENSQIESLEAFAIRARAWISANLSPASDERRTREEGLAMGRVLQAKIFDAGFAGIAVPTCYGGAGLTLDHQRVWAEEVAGYEIPDYFKVSVGMMMPTVLEYGTEAVKRRHIPKILRGDEIWIQLLSEPSGGSDLAGALTRAEATDGGYRVNGSKMWSSGAKHADYGLCMARVDWDVPKHQGLIMLIVDLKAPGLSVHPIMSAQGGMAHFCMEYLDDVLVPEDYRLGGETDGWTVAQRLLFHERNGIAGVGYGQGYGGSNAGGSGSPRWRLDLSPIVRDHGLALDDPAYAASLAEDYVETVVTEQLEARIEIGMRSGKLQGQWASLLKLDIGSSNPRNAERAIAIAGADGVIWSDDHDDHGGEVALHWLAVRGGSIAGGSNEIQRNIVSERLMDLPREPNPDKATPFGEVIRRAKR